MKKWRRIKKSDVKSEHETRVSLKTLELAAHFGTKVVKKNVFKLYEMLRSLKI